MFGREQGGQRLEPSTYVEDLDIFNSELIYRLSKVGRKVDYEITKYECRPDLIAADIYGKDSYQALLMFCNKMRADEFTIGKTIKYYEPVDIDQL